MRLALLTSALPADTAGGAEQYAWNLAESLAQWHTVTVITASRAEPASDLDVIRLPPTPDFDAAGGLAHKVLWHARDQWRPDVHGALRGVLRRLGPDVVHSHNAQGLSAAAFTAIAAAGVPHVHTAHDFNLLCARVSMTRAGEPCGGACATCRVQRLVRGSAVRRGLFVLIAPSEYARRIHVDAGIVPTERSLTVRQGARPGTARLRGTAEPVRFGFIGALAPHKGVTTLLQAAAGLRGAWSLALAGAGPLADRVASCAAGTAEVQALGWLEGTSKERFYDALDVLVVPSEWAENAPLVLAEAAVRGIPAIVSDRGGLPETPAAWVVPARDPVALGALLQTLIDDPGPIRSRSAVVLGRSDEFDWGRHVARVVAMLQRAAASGVR